MWKWVLVGVGIVVFLAILAGIMYIAIEPQGFTDFILNVVDKFDVTIDGKKLEVKINKFDKGLGPKDRTFLVKKMLVLFARTGQDPNGLQMSQEYNRALAKAADDQKLTREENSILREMFDDVVTEDDVNNWLDEFEKLKKSEKQGDIKL
jgi:hypothetical protein